MNFNNIQRNSRDIALRTNEFQTTLDGLKYFENNLSHLNIQFKDIEPIYEDDKFGLKIQFRNSLGEITHTNKYNNTDKVISDVMNKTGVDFEATKRIFDAIRYVPNLSNLEVPIAYDFYKQTWDVSKRDIKDFKNTQHRLLFHDNIARALVNRDFPYKVFMNGSFIESFMEVAETKGKTIEAPRLTFNKDNGMIKGKFLFDKIYVENASINDTVGFGLDIKDGKFGGNNFEFSVGMEVLACTNGMTSTEGLNVIKLRHSSEANFANHFSAFFEKVLNIPSLSRDEYAIVKYLNIKKMMPTEGDFSDIFYNMLANAVFDTVEKQKMKSKIILETAASKSLGDFAKALDNIWKNQYLPIKDKDVAKDVWENDDLINSKNPSKYDFSNMFSRMANNPSWSEEKKEQYQKIAYEILVTV